MQPQAQLEIISPSGKVEFHLLDPTRGVTNIGRHPDNDVILDSPAVDLFQAVLDHQQRPFRIMILSEQAEVRLGGQLLAPNVFQELHAWDTVEMDGYAIILLEGTDAAEHREAMPAPAPVPAVPPALQETAAPAGPVAVVTRPPDEVDEIIVAEVSAREWTLDVEQTASFELTVTNGGSIVASFEIGLEGVDGRWVTISPDTLNLNEGARGTVAVSITPPRLPTSSAGAHHLAVVVTSPNHPARVSRLGATLTINPYYEFAVGELSPKQQTVSWRKQSGQASLPVANRGNSMTTFRLEGDDDERGCRFEFELPGEEARLARQAELRLAPEETRVLPVLITPTRRRLIGLRARSYSYTITTTLVQAAQTPRSVMGQIKSRPLVGPLFLLLIVVGIVALLAFLAWPGKPLLEEEQMQGRPTTTMLDKPVTLHYNGYRVRSGGVDSENILNRLNALFLELRLEFSSDGEEWRTVRTSAEFADIAGTLEVVPAANGWYRLSADTWISNLFPSIGKSDRIRVLVTPVMPTLKEFQPMPPNPLSGSEVTISWRVEGAEGLTLSWRVEGAGAEEEETLPDDELESGRRTLTLDDTTIFTLLATNRFYEEGVKLPSLTVEVEKPTPTPIPTPIIERFDVNPQEITVGETVRLSWQVTGADTVMIRPPGEEVPPQGERGDQPTTLTTYWLTASKEGAENSARLLVIVNPAPTETPVPKAPDVQVFDAVPKQIVEGDDTAIALTWSVAGTTTDIQITGAGVPITGLKPQGSISIIINEGTIFVLTAYNGQLTSSKHVQIGTVEATPVPPEAPVIADFSAEVEAGKLVSYNPDTEVYKILEDATVTLKWVVLGEEVVIELNGKRVSGEEKDMGPIDKDVDYQLLARNEGGDDVRDLYIRIVARVLPAPEDFGYDSSTGVFSWTYPRPDGIEGFRLYKTPGQRVLVAATASLLEPWSTLPKLPAPVPGDAGYVYSWTLEDCEDGTYFLVAVYKDPYNDNALTETDAAEDSWGVTCPTPTPTG